MTIVAEPFSRFLCRPAPVEDAGSRRFSSGRPTQDFGCGPGIDRPRRLNEVPFGFPYLAEESAACHRSRSS